MQNDTVAAISTPAGEGAVGVVRISGENAFLVAEKIFKSFSGKKVADIIVLDDFMAPKVYKSVFSAELLVC